MCGFIPFIYPQVFQRVSYGQNFISVRLTESEWNELYRYNSNDCQRFILIAEYLLVDVKRACMITFPALDIADSLAL